MTRSLDRHFIDGAWVAPAQGQYLAVENPATRETVTRVPDGTEADVDLAVAAAQRAQPAWGDTPMTERIALMRAMLAHFRAMREEIIALEVAELGAPVRFTSQTHCDLQFERIEAAIDAAVSFPMTETYIRSTVIREPVGTVACITPWNYPLGQVVVKVVPAVLAGNTVVLKPSCRTPLTAMLLAEAFRLAGFPAGVFNLVCGAGAKLGSLLARHPGIDMVSFTGSTAVGTELGREALGTMKRISLELGGKSPAIWLPSADYRPALDKLISSVFFNAGQTCTSLSRLLVPAKDLTRIEALLKEAVAGLKVGDPQREETDIGPVSSHQQFEKIAGYIHLGLEEGARLLTGSIPSEPAPGEGYYIRPVIFTDVKNTMRIAREEIFGPVLCVLTYNTVDEAVTMANDTPYGLSGMVYSESKADAVAVAKRLKAGGVYINDAKRDITAPFGGYKESGLGREGGAAGLIEFTQQKTLFDHCTFG